MSSALLSFCSHVKCPFFVRIKEQKQAVGFDSTNTYVENVSPFFVEERFFIDGKEISHAEYVGTYANRHFVGQRNRFSSRRFSYGPRADFIVRTYTDIGYYMTHDQLHQYEKTHRLSLKSLKHKA